MNQDKYKIFLEITKKLNKINIIPLLMGSVGLELLTNKSFNSNDLDIHVPGDKRGREVDPKLNIFNWGKISIVMNELGYSLIDLHEHEFEKGCLSVSFGIIDTLPEFAGIELDELELKEDNNIKYYLLTLEQYLKVYEASSKDSYRNDNNNMKDFEKIKFLHEELNSKTKKEK